LKSPFTQACDDSRERLCRPDAAVIHMHDDDASVAR
jgi:hypothetical protein